MKEEPKQGSEVSLPEDSPIQWHPAFYAGIQIEFGKVAKYLTFESEHLLGLETVYLYPSYEPFCGLNGGISPENVEKSLQENQDIEAVVITSPSYDGIVSDIARIAQILHSHGIPLIVDEAHGAHFAFHQAFPISALELGADVVIHSLHKTLPALTQTALLHQKGNRVSTEKLEEFLGIYETSSPSYLLMGGISYCLRFLVKQSSLCQCW